MVQEFFEQGDAERALNLTISPNMDRTSSDQYAISLGFIDFLCKPFLEVLTDLLPALAPLLDNLNANREKWAELQREEKERAEREAVEREVEAAEAAARAGRISVSRTTTQGTEEVPIGAREEGGEGHEQLPAQFGRLSLSARSSVDASSLSTEPASPISSKRSLPDESASGGGRRFSAAAGTIELPDANWFATHRRPSRPAKGLSALHSFSAFLNWKRLHSGASTPNLVGLLQQQQGGEQPGAVERTASSPNSTRRLTADAAAVDYFSSGGGVGAETGPSEDVLQAIGWDDFVATEEQKEAIKESATVPGRRRSGPNLSGLGMTMTVLNERERLKKRVGGTGALRSASVDVYRPSAGVDEEGKGQ